MARLPVVTRDMVPAEFVDAFDELTRPTGGTITGGPYSIAINSPEMARRRSSLTGYLRFESTFSKRIQELAILATARNFDCPYIWNAHAPAARREGVSDALVDAIRDRKPLPAMADDERAIVNYCNEFYANHRVSASTFQIALEQFGAQHLVEITALMGNYAQTAFFLNAFEVELPADRSEPVLPVSRNTCHCERSAAISSGQETPPQERDRRVVRQAHHERVALLAMTRRVRIDS